MSRREPPGSSDPRKVALLIDLLAGALEAGLPVEHALIAVAAAASPDRLTDDAAAGPTGRPIDGAVRDRSADDFAEAARPFGQLGRMLSLGAEPEAAWSSLAAVPDLAVAATAGRRCAHSGARLAQALRSAAEQIREQRHARSVARAERLGVWVLLPLGLCFLPAFVCLGILPTILGVARGVGVLGIGMP